MTWLFTTRFTRRARYIEAFRFPLALEDKLARGHPEWSTAQRREVLEGLRDFFLACLHAQRAGDAMLGMPSTAVDEAWHEFILITRAYADFCRHAFGRYLHHAPEGTMEVPIPLALRTTARHLRRLREDGDRRLFTLDSSVGANACLAGATSGAHGAAACGHGHGCGASCGSGCGGGGCGSC